jgi:RNA-binding protein
MTVPATSPKKKSLMPSGDLRRRLRGLAHALAPILQVGKEGVTPAVVRQMTGALHDHELIKAKIGSECPASRFEVAEQLAGEPGVNVVQILGRVLVLYKRHPQEPRYEGPNAGKPPAPKREPAPRKPAPERAKGKKPFRAPTRKPARRPPTRGRR